MNCEEALKRLKQETCPCTYNQDFDKDECLKVIKNEIDELKEFASLMAETLDLDEEENQVQCNTYFFNTKVFDLVKRVVSRYGSKANR